VRLRRTMGALGSAVIGALLLAATLAPAPAAAADAALDPAAVEAEFVARINALRTEKGLAPLAVDGELTTIARRWAARMAEAGEISHNRNFSREVTANWVKLGENVGRGPEVGRIHAAFVASPSHYKNLVDPDYQLVGVGVVVTAGGMIFTAHQFERLAPSPAAAAPAPPASASAPRGTRPVPAAAAPSPPIYAVEVLETLRRF
jgi:uncharacterized protein YkwD